jgi:hypothetical protein
MAGIVFAVLFYCPSRAAVLLLFAGCVVWMTGVVGRRLPLWVAGLVLVLMMGAGGVFYMSKAPSKEKITKFISDDFQDERSLGSDSATDAAPSELALEGASSGEFNDTIPFDFRLLEYRDTLDLIADHPISGVGLGNYRYISSQYRRASLSDAVAIHTDSSLLLIPAESGVLALGAVAALIVLAFLRVRGCRSHPSWSVRWASAVAVAIFLIHSCFDIPAHRTATLLPALFLAGLAFRKPLIGSSAFLPLWPARTLFAASGAAFLAAAGWLAGWIPSPLSVPPTVQVENARNEVYALYKDKSMEEAIDVAKDALAQTPLASDLYFQWGALELSFEDTDQQAEQLFATERVLEPCLTMTPLKQAEVWLQINPSRAQALFADAMSRAVKIEKHGNAHTVRVTYARIIQLVAQYQETNADLVQSLRPLAGNDRDLILLWMKLVPPDVLTKTIAEFRSQDPSLNSWSHPEKRALFRLWHHRGNRNELMEQIKLQPAWAQDAWPIMAADLALSGKYQDAWSLASGKIHLAPPSHSEGDSDIQQLRDIFAERRTPETAEMLTKALFFSHEWDGVMQMASTYPTGPTLRMASLAAVKLNLWNDAWSYLVAAIRHQDESFTPE